MQAQADAWAGAKQRVALPGGRSLAYVEQSGQAPTLFCLHGYTDSSRSFAPLVPFLKGHHLVIPDLAGHGVSQAPAAVSLAGLEDDLVALAGHCRFRDCVIIGHSMGSMLAVRLAASRRLSVSGLVLIGSACRPRFSAHLVSLVESLSDPVAADHPVFAGWHDCAVPVDAGFLAHLADEAARLSAQVWQGLLRDMQGLDLSEDVAKIDCRVLSIGGFRDQLFSPDDRQVLMANMRHGRSVELPGHGHNPHWENPGLVADLILGSLPVSVPGHAALA